MTEPTPTTNRSTLRFDRFVPGRAGALLTAILFASSVAAQNWPQFRGPNAGGLGDGSPPTTWNVETGDNVRWKTDIPGLAHSSPVVWGERVFIATAVADSNTTPELGTGWMGGTGRAAKEESEWSWTFQVLSLDKKTGRVLWKRDAYAGVPKIKRHPKATHANCTPATDGEHVVAFFGSEGLYCYDFDGNLLWKKDLGLLDAGPYNAPSLQWSFASSPIIHDGRVIVQCDANNTNFWAAFDVRTGKELRRVERDEVSTWSTPAIFKTPERTLVVLNGYKQMAAYDLSSGEQVWRLSGGGDVPVPTPLVAHGLVFLTNGHGRSPIFAIRAGARGDLTPADGERSAGMAWRKSKGGSYVPTPIIVGENIYVGDDVGRLRVADARSGEPRYAKRLPGRSNYSASPVAAGGKIYFTSEDGDVHVVQAGGTYKLLGSNQMNAICMATPAISDGVLYVRTRRQLVCIGE